jgi:hypothetical protein
VKGVFAARNAPPERQEASVGSRRLHGAVPPKYGRSPGPGQPGRGENQTDTTQTEQGATNDHGPSVLLIALGAILLFAVMASVAGVTKVIGLILIVAGALDLLTALTTGARREPI